MPVPGTQRMKLKKNSEMHSQVDCGITPHAHIPKVDDQQNRRSDQHVDGDVLSVYVVER